MHINDGIASHKSLAVLTLEDLKRWKVQPMLLSTKKSLFSLLVLASSLSLVYVADAAPIPTYSYDAAVDNDGDQYWQHQAGPTYNRDWNFGTPTSPTAVTSDSTDFTQAYRFGPGEASAATTSTFGRNDYPLGNAEEVAFEFWVKPTDLSGQEVIFETGGHTSGVGLRLDGSSLQSRSEYGNSASTHTTYDLPSYLADDFMQVVVVSDHQAGAEHHKLFVNGIPVSQNGDARGWHDGTDGAGLGGINNALGGYDSVGSFGDFNGDIALAQMYTNDLTDAEVWEAFVAHAGSFTPTKVKTPGATLDYQLIESNNITADGATVRWDDQVDTIANTAADINITGTKILPYHNEAFPGIHSSLDFDGSTTWGRPVGNGGDGTALFGDEVLGDALSEQNATFEMWFHPDVVNDPGRQQILFESGGTGDGLAMYLDGSELVFGVKSGGNTSEIGYQLDADTNGTLDDVFGDFIQAVGVIDFDNDTVQLYVDGELVAEDLSFLGVDWAGGNGTGIGRANDDVYWLADSNGLWFDGQIAAMSYYDWALSQQEILDNFYSMAAAPVPEPGTISLMALIFFGSIFYLRRKR